MTYEEKYSDVVMSLTDARVVKSHTQRVEVRCKFYHLQ
jgi:hypothetical protein